jgi:hypothetical protein
MTLERLNYYPGQRLDAADFKDEQRYHLEMRRRLNQGLFTPGVVSGLEVSKVTGEPRRVRVAPGLALDPLGRPAVLVKAAIVDVPNQPPSTTPGYYYLLLRYGEEAVPGGTRECAPGTAAPSRIAERPTLHFSERLPDPQRCPQDPDSLDCAVTIALVTLDSACQVQSIESGLRQYSYPTHTSRVQAVAIEGEKDIDEENPKQLYFHVRGGPPSSVVLFLRGGAFSSLHYTELGLHNHAFSSISLGSSVTTLAGHSHDLASHTHALSSQAITNNEPTSPNGHRHTLRSAGDDIFGNAFLPSNEVSTANFNTPITYHARGPGASRDFVEGGQHRHTFNFALAGAPGSTGPASAPSPSESHTHQMTSPVTVGGTGGSGYIVRGGAAYTWLDELHVFFDGQDITDRIIDLQPDRWRLFGSKLGDGGAGHPFNTDGTGEVDLLDLGLVVDEGREHLLEFQVRPADPNANPARLPNGGKVLYQLYIE